MKNQLNKLDEKAQATSDHGVWLTSKEAKKQLKISDCELMHQRERGELIYEKRGRAYYYYLNTK